MSSAAALSFQNNNRRKGFTVVSGTYKKKYTKDGDIKKTHSNRVSGTSSEVYAFRTKEEIKAMLDVFDARIKEAKRDDYKKAACRDKLMFLLGINAGLRASDIRLLHWNFFFDEDGNYLDGGKVQPKKTKKTKKFVPIFVSDVMKKAIDTYIKEYPIDDYDTYIFTSRKKTGRKRGNDVDEADNKGNMPISEASIWNALNNAAKEAGIKQNIGSHSLRKTYGYWIYHNADNKEDALVKLQILFGHSSTRVTARYIGITDDELKDTIQGLNIGLDFM